MPAEPARSRAQRVRRVDGAIDEKPRGRTEDVCEDAPAFELDNLAVPSPDQLVREVVFTVSQQPRRAPLEVRQENGPILFSNDLAKLFHQSSRRLVDPNVDLAAAGETHAE